MNMSEQANHPPQPTSDVMKQFEILVGEWSMVGIHPKLPSTAYGRSSFKWLVEGGLLTWHFDWERGGPPSALSVIGHDDAFETCSMLYSDERAQSLHNYGLLEKVFKERIIRDAGETI